MFPFQGKSFIMIENAKFFESFHFRAELLTIQFDVSTGRRQDMRTKCEHFVPDKKLVENCLQY